MGKVKIEDILNKINDRIFNLSVTNQKNGDNIMKLNPDLMKRDPNEYIDGMDCMSAITNKHNNPDENTNNVAPYDHDIISCNNLSESIDMESYVASVSPPIVTIDSDIFSIKKNSDISKKHTSENSNGYYH